MEPFWTNPFPLTFLFFVDSTHACSKKMQFFRSFVGCKKKYNRCLESYIIRHRLREKVVEIERSDQAKRIKRERLDKVDQEELVIALERIGVPDDIIKMIETAYQSNILVIMSSR